MYMGTESQREKKTGKDWEGMWCWKSSGQTAQKAEAIGVQDPLELCCPQLIAAQPCLSMLLSQGSLGDAVIFITAVGYFCSLPFPVSPVIGSCFLYPSLVYRFPLVAFSLLLCLPASHWSKLFGNRIIQYKAFSDPMDFQKSSDWTHCSKQGYLWSSSSKT